MSYVIPFSYYLRPLSSMIFRDHHSSYCAHLKRSHNTDPTHHLYSGEIMCHSLFVCRCLHVTGCDISQASSWNYSMISKILFSFLPRLKNPALQLPRRTLRYYTVAGRGTINKVKVNSIRTRMLLGIHKQLILMRHCTLVSAMLPYLPPNQLSKKLEHLCLSHWNTVQ